MRGRPSRTLTLLMAALVVGACQGQLGGAAGATVRFVRPEDGASVRLPVTVELSVDVPVGPKGGDEHYLQIYIDGLLRPEFDETTFEITDLVPGDHAIHASVFEPDGEPALGDDAIAIRVVGD